MKKIRIFFVIASAVALLTIIGCGTNSSGSDNAKQDSKTQPTGNVSVSMQLFDTQAAKASFQSAEASTADDLELRKKIDHVVFKFQKPDGTYLPAQTLAVVNGSLDGTLAVEPGLFMLELEFLIKEGAKIYNAETEIQVNGGETTKVVPIIKREASLVCKSVLLDPQGKYTLGEKYWGDMTINDMPQPELKLTAVKGGLAFTGSYGLKPLTTGKMKLRIKDDDKQYHEAVFEFDPLKFIDSLNEKGVVDFEWPENGTVDVGGIFEDDQTGYLKASVINAWGLYRGKADQHLLSFRIKNLLDKPEEFTSVTIRMFDVRYISNAYIMDGLGKKSDCTIKSQTDWGSGKLICYANGYLEAKSEGGAYDVYITVASDYKGYDFSAQIVAIGAYFDGPAAPNSGDPVPFLMSDVVKLKI
jgi:hypothetical protein